MRISFAAAVLFTLAPVLSACGSSRGKVQSASASVRKPTTGSAGTRRPVRTPAVRPPPAAVVQKLPGLEGVIGQTALDLTRQFGPARLDVWEGDARKLQFTGTPCVLDVFLYPKEQGREPQVTYVDARRTDGRDVDRAACVQALRKR
jgi:hypothetical protein